MSNIPKQCQDIYDELDALMQEYRQYISQVEEMDFLESVEVNRHKYVSRAVKQKQKFGSISDADIEGFYADYLKELKNDLLIRLAGVKKDDI